MTILYVYIQPVSRRIIGRAMSSILCKKEEAQTGAAVVLSPLLYAVSFALLFPAVQVRPAADMRVWRSARSRLPAYMC